MPRGYPKAKVQAGEVAADSVVRAAQSTAQTVMEQAGRVVRSRDEEEAERVANEFLKNNRVNLVGFEQRLPHVPERLGWVRRWVNDMNSRIPSLMERGWKIVNRGAAPSTTDSVGRGNTDIGGQVSITSTAGDGPLRVVLMEVPKKLFDMQVEASLQPVRMTEQAIREGRNGLSDTEHVYTPKGVENRIETTV